MMRFQLGDALVRKSILNGRTFAGYDPVPPLL